MKEDEEPYHLPFMGDQDILDKSILTDEEMDEYLQKTEEIDPKREHDHLYSVMTIKPNVNC
jgi:hypothetical protein